jgi:hypothetical protein
MFSKNVFFIARSTFRMYSVMAIINSSIVWGLFEYTEFFVAPQRKKIGRRKILGSWRPNDFRNDSVRKYVVQECHRHVRCMSRSAILLKVGLVYFIFFQLRNEGIHNSVTIPLGVESLREKKWVRLFAYATFQPKHQSSNHAAATRGTHENWTPLKYCIFACFFVL